MRLLLTSLFLLCAKFSAPQEIREFMDLQIHPTMHMVYSFFGEGLQYFDENDPPELSHKHLLKNVAYANYLRNNEGMRILVVGALTKEGAMPPEKARQKILEQIEFVNKFAADNSEDFVVARSPQEVRNFVHNTDKTIIIHSIEGGRNIINSAEDAQFWAAQGVAFITLVHLVDSQFGGAAIRPGLPTHLINFKGHFKKKRKRGLTEKGKQAILWLANAGVMTDLTHMAEQTRKEALDFMEEKGIPPLVTHDMFKPIQNSPRGVDANDVLRIYRNGGFMALPVSGISLKPHHPFPEYQSKIDSLDRYCPGSIDDFKFTYLELKNYIENNVDSIFPNKASGIATLSEAEKVDISIGFQTDFNGWLDHHRPRYGEEGCYEMEPDTTYEAIELQGLAHPGLMASHWRLLEKEDVDLQPVKRSSEKFLRMWELFLERKGEY